MIISMYIFIILLILLIVFVILINRERFSNDNSSNLLIITFANHRNSFLDEWEESVKRQNLQYKILGNGVKWEGWATRTNIYLHYLETLNPDKIIILCDGFDLVFLANEDEIMEKYKKMEKPL